MSEPRKGFRRCKKCERNRAERFFVGARGTVCSSCRRSRNRSHSRGQRLGETYGITLDDYDALFAAQGGRCAICRGSRRQNLDVDHDHKLEREHLARGVAAPEAARSSIRGLLCAQCNRRILRSCRDNPDILLAAVDYLVSPPAQRILQRQSSPRGLVNRLKR